jgi:hypothetical protein
MSLIYNTLAAMADHDNDNSFNSSPTVDEIVTFLTSLVTAGKLQTSYEYLDVGGTAVVDAGFQSLKFFLEGIMDNGQYSTISDSMIAEIDYRFRLKTNLDVELPESIASSSSSSSS